MDAFLVSAPGLLAVLGLFTVVGAAALALTFDAFDSFGARANRSAFAAFVCWVLSVVLGGAVAYSFFANFVRVIRG